MNITCNMRSRMKLTIPAEFIKEAIMERFDNVPEDADFWLESSSVKSVDLGSIDRIRVNWTEEEEIDVV